MKEVKSPKRPLIWYYGVAMIVLLLFNLILSPMLISQQVVEADCGTFMRMIEEEDIGQVQVENSQIIFTDKEGTQVYKTGAMNDPGLTSSGIPSTADTGVFRW